MRVREFIRHTGPIVTLWIFLDQSRFLKSEKGPGIVNDVTRIFSIGQPERLNNTI